MLAHPPFLHTRQDSDTTDTSDTSDTKDTNVTNLIGNPLAVSPGRFVSQKCSDTPRGCQVLTYQTNVDSPLGSKDSEKADEWYIYY